MDTDPEGTEKRKLIIWKDDWLEFGGEPIQA